MSKKLKILIAEDDKLSKMLLNKLVKPYSDEVLHADNGLEALQLTKDNPDIDMILMDIKMPEMDGYEATRNIRMFNKDVVIIAQTAYVHSDGRDKAIMTGCNDFLAKPINAAKLERMIKKYLPDPRNF